MAWTEAARAAAAEARKRGTVGLQSRFKQINPTKKSGVDRNHLAGVLKSQRRYDSRAQARLLVERLANRGDIATRIVTTETVSRMRR
jgi:hypothetical protein